MSLPKDPKPRMSLTLKLIIGMLSVAAICLVLFVVIRMAATDAQHQQTELSAPSLAAPVSPDPVATEQPLIKFAAADYPCSKNLYAVRNRIEKGTDLATVGKLGADTTAYCRKILQAVGRLPTIEAKVNHLLVEYCMLAYVAPSDNVQPPDPHAINLQDIYGSLYGTVRVTYDKAYDDYSVEWVQRPTNGQSAYFVGGWPSLEPLANKYCPAAASSQLPQTGTGQG
jgi:hypothetical protein